VNGSKLLLQHNKRSLIATEGCLSVSSCTEQIKRPWNGFLPVLSRLRVVFQLHILSFSGYGVLAAGAQIRTSGICLAPGCRACSRLMSDSVMLKLSSQAQRGRYPSAQTHSIERYISHNWNTDGQIASCLAGTSRPLPLLADLYTSYGHQIFLDRKLRRNGFSDHCDAREVTKAADGETNPDRVSIF
jgi:hypothetical protein